MHGTLSKLQEQEKPSAALTHMNSATTSAKNNQDLFKDKSRALELMRRFEHEEGEGRTWGEAGEETASAGDWSMSGRQSGLHRMMEEGWRRHG